MSFGNSISTECFRGAVLDSICPETCHIVICIATIPAYTALTECNYSSQYSLHLLLFSHYTLSGFRAHLLSCQPSNLPTICMWRAPKQLQNCLVLTQHCVYLGAIHWLSTLWRSKRCNSNENKALGFTISVLVKEPYFWFWKKSSIMYKGQI